MNIQPINQQTNNNIGFQKLIVKKGSFETLKKSQYFPDESYPNYHENLKNFYKKLMKLRKKMEKNDVYNVVIRPNSKELEGGIYIENSEGRQQTGFFKSFDKLLEVEAKEPVKLLTKEQDPNFFDRFFRNWKRKRYNKQVERKQVNMPDFLNLVIKHIEEMTNNADYLAELHNLKK